MLNLDDYINLISRRGSQYGDGGGVYSLLLWCSKNSTQEVTLAEARAFYENPGADYAAVAEESAQN